LTFVEFKFDTDIFKSLSKKIWREEMKVAFQILEHLLWREKSLNLYISGTA